MGSEVLLDTNVLSELMRPRPDNQVVDWFGQQASTDYFISAITQAEILLGIALLPDGKRRNELADVARQMFVQEFADRCLPYDAKAAEIYAEVVASRIRMGQPISTEDAQISAVALSHRFPLATRNVKDFSGINGLILINPWAAPEAASL